MWPSQIGDAPVVLDGVGAVQPVVERGAVLGDQQRDLAVVASQPDEQVGEVLGRDRPAHRGLLEIRREVGDVQRPVGDRGGPVRPVEVDAEEVERLRDRLQVAGPNRVERPEPGLVEGDHVLGVRRRGRPGRGTSGCGGRRAGRRPRGRRRRRSPGSPRSGRA